MDEQPLNAEIEAEYTLEASVRCPHCREQIERVHVVRLLRTRVNFTSSLPRRGQIMICPSCQTFLAGDVGGIL